MKGDRLEIEILSILTQFDSNRSFFVYPAIMDRMITNFNGKLTDKIDNL